MQEFKFRQGFPLVEDYRRVLASDAFHEMREFSREFLILAEEPLKLYRWAADPFYQWSRQYEYPFVYEGLRRFASTRQTDPIRVLDAGSGITFFPYFLRSRMPNLSVECCDADGSLWPIFLSVNQIMDCPIPFHATDLRHLSLASETYDVVYCISVLEHTGEYQAILEEFHRVLKPGGRLILTFDLCLQGPADIPIRQARGLLAAVSKHFRFSDGFDAESCLRNLPEESQVLTTRFAGRIDRRLLPSAAPWKTAWNHALGGLLKRDMRPLLKFVAMLNHLTCFCVTAEKV